MKKLFLLLFLASCTSTSQKTKDETDSRIEGGTHFITNIIRIIKVDNHEILVSYRGGMLHLITCKECLKQNKRL